MPHKYELDLSLISPVLYAQAQRAIDERDVVLLLVCMDNTANLAFVFDNAHALRERGWYETALVSAYSATRTNFREWDLQTLKFLLSLADRAKLREIAPPPEGETFTLYRGVAGKGKQRRPSGLSWTDDLDKARWFARRFPHLEDPAVYTATVSREEVYWFDNDRTERDFILYTKKFKRMK